MRSSTLRSFRSEPAQKMRISKKPFGESIDGRDVDLWCLENDSGITVEVLNFGGVIYSFRVPDREGNAENITANHETIAEYRQYRNCFGSLVGRFANRIADGRFVLDGKTHTLPINNPPNCLHGGYKGFDQVIWNIEKFTTDRSVGVRLDYVSKDGQEGFPGNLRVQVVYELDNENRWSMDYRATTDKPTVVNLTNHAFWNLSGFRSETILDHELTIHADSFLVGNKSMIPTGEFRSVEGTPLDFQTPHRIGSRIDMITEPGFNGGYDHCFVLRNEKPGKLVSCAKVVDPLSGRIMIVSTTQPAVQLYTANFLTGSSESFGQKHIKHAGLCLETQHFPDSPNHSEFPSTVLRPGETYRETTVHEFGNLY